MLPPQQPSVPDLQFPGCLLFFYFIIFLFKGALLPPYNSLAKTILEATLTIQSLTELHAIFLLGKEAFLGAEMQSAAKSVFHTHEKGTLWMFELYWTTQ